MWLMKVKKIAPGVQGLILAATAINVVNQVWR
jgi:hypothetical protein